MKLDTGVCYKVAYKWRHDIHHNDTEDNDIQQNDAQ